MSERVCECGHSENIHKAYNTDECGACPCEKFQPVADAAMPEGAEAHLERIKQEFFRQVDAKYRKGQLEHGGQLWRKPRMSAKALEEALDLIVYLLTLIEQEKNPAQVSEALGQDEK